MTGQSAFGVTNSHFSSSLANASEAAHRSGFAHFARPGPTNGSSNGFATNSTWTGGGVGVPSLPQQQQLYPSYHFPSSSSSNGDGSSSAPIDVDSMPTPRPTAAPTAVNPKKPVCIGAFMTRAIMLYPNNAAIVGSKPPPGSRWTIISYKGAEMIHVKLRVSPMWRQVVALAQCHLTSAPPIAMSMDESATRAYFHPSR